LNRQIGLCNSVISKVFVYLFLMILLKFFTELSNFFRFAIGLFFGMSQGGITYPFSIIPSFCARSDAFFITRAMAFDDLPKLIPINLTKIIMACFVIKF